MVDLRTTQQQKMLGQERGGNNMPSDAPKPAEDCSLIKCISPPTMVFNRFFFLFHDYDFITSFKSS